MEESASPTQDSFDRNKLAKFLKHMINVLPTPYSSQDSNRLTLIYFVIGALDLIGELDTIDKSNVVEYIYSLQVLPDKDDPKRNAANCGFRGGSFFGTKHNPKCEPTSAFQHDLSHIAMTYTALGILKMCGDSNDGSDPNNTTLFSRVHKPAIIEALKHLQQPDGSFCPVAGGGENDMRFVYCAAAISRMLNDFSGIDVDRAVKYIVSSISYDGGIAQGPGQESHGGSTYCAVAALSLMNRLDAIPDREKLIQWCVERQVSGFQGRINKIADTCYSFWIGASLTLLDAYHLVDFRALRGHTLSCEQDMGGFAKWPDQYPDVLHTYMSLCGLSLGGEPGLKSIDCGLGFNRAVAELFSR